MTLYQSVKENRDLLQEGIAFIAFYKKGRSWFTEDFWNLDDPELYDLEQIPEIEKIIKIDPNAMIFNGYINCPDTEFLNMKELYNLIKVFYLEQRCPAKDWLVEIKDINE